jgi:hypothetical protein
VVLSAAPALSRADANLESALTPANHPGVELRANLKSISHRCRLFEVAFVWELTKETIHLLLGCVQGGYQSAVFGAPKFTSRTLCYDWHDPVSLPTRT